MADQVTISTFLELRDNMSEGLKRIADALQVLSGHAPKAQTALNNITKSAEEASKRIKRARSDEERAAESKARAEAKAIRELDNMLREQERNRQKIEKHLRRSAEMRAREQVKSEAKAKRDALSETRAVEQLRIQEARQYQQEVRRGSRELERAMKREYALQAKSVEHAQRVNKKIQDDRARMERATLAAAQRSVAASIRGDARRMRSNERAADAAIREAKRVQAAVDRIRRRDAMLADRDARKAGQKETAGSSKEGLAGSLLKANLATQALERVSSFLWDGISGYVVKGIQLNAQYEKSISAISSAMFTMDISPSMRVAEAYTEEVIGTLRRMAAVLPGEAAEYVEVYQRTIPAALLSGMRDSKKYAEFISKYTAVAVQRGVGARVAATNLQIMLGGTARAGTKMAQVLSAYTGKTIQDINKMKRAARLDLLQKAVDEAASGMSASATKMDAVFGTFKSHLEEIVRLGNKPLFEIARSTLIDMNKWLEKNKASIVALSGVFTENLGYAVRGVVEELKELFGGYLGGIISTSQTMAPEEQLAEAQRRLAELSQPKEKDFDYYLNALKSFYVDMKSPAAALFDVAKEKAMGVALKGQVVVLKEQIAKLAELKAVYTKRERERGITRPISPTESTSAVSFALERLISSKFFDVPGKPMKTVFDEYLQAKGFSDLAIQELYQDLIRRSVIAVDTAPEVETKKAPGDRARNNTYFYNNRFDIKQEFAEGFDPDRIAVAFANDLGRLGELKLQGAYGQVGNVR